LSSRSIAVFQAEHGLQVHTINVVKALEAAGYDVDLFFYGFNYNYDTTDGVRSVYDFSSKRKYWNRYPTRPGRLMEAFRYFVVEPLKPGKAPLMPQELLDESLKIAREKRYLCHIGVEKHGLVWATYLSRLTGAPTLYYSLELYPTKNVFYQSKSLKALRFLRLRQLEKASHRRAQATIVQDPSRANELMRENGVERMENLFVPVSLPGPPLYKKSDYLRDLFSLSPQKKIILQFGVLGGLRLADEVASAAQTFPPDWVLVFHGLVRNDEIVERIRQIDKGNRIIVSRDMVPSDKLDELVSSADVGLCFYGRKHVNDYLVGFSSEKLARYVKCGLPVVAFDYPTFLQSVRDTGCGVCIPELSSLTDAISNILKDYEGFRERAFNTFLEHFEFNKQFEKVISYVSALAGEAPSDRPLPPEASGGGRG
jgi:glycosyltransferase involved in cell wall biosynthesis